MSPITEDQVVALMDGFAAREKDKIKSRHSEMSGEAGRVKSTGRVLPFVRKANVVALDAHRAKRENRGTMSGVFLYISGRDVTLA